MIDWKRRQPRSRQRGAAGELAAVQSGSSVEALPSAAPQSKPAGRNLRVATIVGASLLVLALFGAWWNELLFAVLLYAAAIIGLLEWRTAVRSSRRHVPAIPSVLAAIGMGVATWFALAEGLVVALLVGCAGVVAWRISDERITGTLQDSVVSMFSLLWIPFLASFFMLMELADDGWQRVFITVLAVVGNDTGALFAGMKFGRTKLAPSVSPKKTREGAIGGVLLATIVAAVGAHLMMDKWWIGAVVGVVAAVAAIFGDLAESLVKRDLGVKDMSSLIPGHGGILDRLDSLLFAAPAAYLVFAILIGTT